MVNPENRRSIPSRISGGWTTIRRDTIELGFVLMTGKIVSLRSAAIVIRKRCWPQRLLFASPNSNAAIRQQQMTEATTGGVKGALDRMLGTLH